MNARERQLIEGIINTEDRRIHNRCIQLLFHGQDIANRNERIKYRKNEYVTALENAVRTCFSGRLYHDKFADIYMVFESLFVTYLERIEPEKLLEVDDLKNWLFVVASRFCNSNRNKINELLGIDTDGTIEFDDRLESSYDDKPELSDEHEKQIDTSNWATSLLDYYIKRISNTYYRDLIRTIKIEGVPVETIAEDYNKTEDDIYRDYNRAWDRLLQTTLPDIKIRSKSLFKKYESNLNDEQAGLLNDFFFGGNDTSSISSSPKTNQNDLEKAIVKAYKVLLKTAKNETELDEKEQRKEVREQHRLEKEEAAKKKNKS